MNFFDRHPNLTSVLATIAFFGFIILCVLFGSCKPTELEIVKTDTLHVYHTDTVHSSHTDTIRLTVTQIIHDSIIKQTIITNVVNEAGEVVHSEKETNNEVWHNSDTNSQLIQHTVDSLLKVKMDSLYQSSHDNETTVIEKEEPWYKKLGGILKTILWIVLCLLVGFGIGWIFRLFRK